MTDRAPADVVAINGLIAENVRLTAELEQAYTKIGDLELKNEFLRRVASGEQASRNSADFNRQREAALTNGRNGVFAG